MQSLESIGILGEYMAKEPMVITATEVQVKLRDIENSKVIQKLVNDIDDWINKVMVRICQTPIQFRFPKSKKERIRKKWRKDPGNFRILVDPDQGIENFS